MTTGSLDNAIDQKEAEVRWREMSFLLVSESLTVIALPEACLLVFWTTPISIQYFSFFALKMVVFKITMLL